MQISGANAASVSWLYHCYNQMVIVTTFMRAKEGTRHNHMNLTAAADAANGMHIVEGLLNANYQAC